MRFTIRAVSGRVITIETEKVVQRDGKEHEVTVRCPVLALRLLRLHIECPPTPPLMLAGARPQGDL